MGAPDHTVFLMYHELHRPGRPLASEEQGYVRYVIEEAEFRAQMIHVAEHGMRGVSVSDWIDHPLSAEQTVVLTFDDGCETDLIAAAPILAECGFGATCYLTVDFLGKRGYLSHAQVRELAATGLEIGSHSMSHAFLSDIDDAALRREVVEAKDRLEQISGARVRSFSCPGGRYDARVLPLARQAGYDSVTTSDATRNSSERPAGLLGRMAILQHPDMRSFDATLSAKDLHAKRTRETVLRVAKSILGNTLYERVRARLLG
ncbi:MAG: polysaccharide deacetylase family protein [bacterium]